MKMHKWEEIWLESWGEELEVDLHFILKDFQIISSGGALSGWFVFRRMEHCESEAMMVADLRGWCEVSKKVLGFRKAQQSQSVDMEGWVELHGKVI